MSKPRETAKRMTSAELRSAFLEFFRGHGHAVVPSSSVWFWIKTPLCNTVT